MANSCRHAETNFGNLTRRAGYLLLMPKQLHSKLFLAVLLIAVVLPPGRLVQGLARTPLITTSYTSNIALAGGRVLFRRSFVYRCWQNLCCRFCYCYSRRSNHCFSILISLGRGSPMDGGGRDSRPKTWPHQRIVLSLFFFFFLYLRFCGNRPTDRLRAGASTAKI